MTKIMFTKFMRARRWLLLAAAVVMMGVRVHADDHFRIGTASC